MLALCTLHALSTALSKYPSTRRVEVETKRQSVPPTTPPRRGVAGNCWSKGLTGMYQNTPGAVQELPPWARRAPSVKRCWPVHPRDCGAAFAASTHASTPAGPAHQPTSTGGRRRRRRVCRRRPLPPAAPRQRVAVAGPGVPGRARDANTGKKAQAAV